MSARNLGLALALLLLGGCGFFAQKHAETRKLGDSGVEAITYPGQIRAAYAVSKDSTVRYCAEPPPDVALSTIEKIAAEAKATTESGLEGEGKLSAEASTTALELAGRTQLVLLAREMLYRACELSLNRSDVNEEDVIDMYKAVVELVRTLGAASLVEAQTKLTGVSVKAQEILAARRTAIDAIMSHVTKADKSIDKDKLKALLDKTESATFVRAYIEGARDKSDLRSRLEKVAPKVLDDIAARIG